MYQILHSSHQYFTIYQYHQNQDHISVPLSHFWDIFLGGGCSPKGVLPNIFVDQFCKNIHVIYNHFGAYSPSPLDTKICLRFKVNHITSLHSLSCAQHNKYFIKRLKLTPLDIFPLNLSGTETNHFQGFCERGGGWIKYHTVFHGYLHRASMPKNIFYHGISKNILSTRLSSIESQPKKVVVVVVVVVVVLLLLLLLLQFLFLFNIWFQCSQKRFI